MPAIKAYTFKNQTIPVNVARTVTVYQCPFTNKIIKTRRNYIKHLKSIRTQRHHKYLLLQVRRHLKTVRELSNIESIVQFIEQNFTDAIFVLSGKDTVTSYPMKITSFAARYYPSISNTHECPDNGVRNWTGRELFDDGTPKPTGYPGFTGTIKYTLPDYYNWNHKIIRLPIGSYDLIKPFGIKPGTGSGGEHCEYTIKMFLDDWPGLAKYVMLQQLSSNDPIGFDYHAD